MPHDIIIIKIKFLVDISGKQCPDCLNTDHHRPECPVHLISAANVNILSVLRQHPARSRHRCAVVVAVSSVWCEQGVSHPPFVSVSSELSSCSSSIISRCISQQTVQVHEQW